MEKLLFMLVVNLCLVIDSIWCHPLRSANTENGLDAVESTTFHMEYLVFVVAAFVCSIMLVMGCMCCQRGGLKGFQSVGNTYVQDNFSDGAATSEFTIFPPIQCNVEQSSLIDVKFEPLPDIKLRGSSSGSSQPRPANFISVVNQGLSVQDWFDEPYNNFPRHNLKYLQEVGSGWFGQVVVGEAQGMGEVQKKKVVVKILREDATPTDQIYFLHEVKMFRDLDHPNIMKLLGKCLECDPFLLILEHCPFNDLKTYLILHRTEASSLIQENLLLRMSCNIAAGLLHMHSHGFIHTDLAARNCLVTADLQVKIGDYGSSIEKFKDNYYCAGDVAVPIRWCAPETLRCTDTIIETKEVTKEANSWSFGVLMWEIAEFGKLPYSELHDEDVLQKVIIKNSVNLQQPETLYNHAERVYQLMKLCWLKDPKLRINAEKLNALLTHLYSYKNSSDFEARWNDLTPSTNRNNHNLGNPPTTLSSLAFEDNFNDITLSHSSNDLKCTSGQHEENPSPYLPLNLEHSIPTGKRIITTSLQNLPKISHEQSYENNSIYQSSPNKSVPTGFPQKNNDPKKTSVKRSQYRIEEPNEKVREEFDAWLLSQEAKGAEASLIARQISEAINDLDDALANEKTSSEDDSSKSSPERDLENKDKEKDVLEASEAINNHPPSSESSSDDETWSKMIEEGKGASIEVTKLVREKSHSVQDFLKLTVIDIDNNSDSDTVLADQNGILNVTTKGISIQSNKEDIINNSIQKSNPLKPLPHVLPLSRLEYFASEIVNASVTLAVSEIQSQYFKMGNDLVDGLGCVTYPNTLTLSLTHHSANPEQLTAGDNCITTVEGKTLTFLSFDALNNFKSSCSNQLSQGSALILTNSAQNHQLDFPCLTNASNDTTALNYRCVSGEFNQAQLNNQNYIEPYVDTKIQGTTVQHNNRFNHSKKNDSKNNSIIMKTFLGLSNQNRIFNLRPFNRSYSETDLMTTSGENSIQNFNFSSIPNIKLCTTNLEAFNIGKPLCISSLSKSPMDFISHERTNGKSNQNDTELVANSTNNAVKEITDTLNSNSTDNSFDEFFHSGDQSSNQYLKPSNDETAISDELKLGDGESTVNKIIDDLDKNIIAQDSILYPSLNYKTQEHLQNLLVPSEEIGHKIISPLSNNMLETHDKLSLINKKITNNEKRNDLVDLMNEINVRKYEVGANVTAGRRICIQEVDVNGDSFCCNGDNIEYEDDMESFKNYYSQEKMLPEQTESFKGSCVNNLISDHLYLNNFNEILNSTELLNDNEYCFNGSDKKFTQLDLMPEIVLSHSSPCSEIKNISQSIEDLSITSNLKECPTVLNREINSNLNIDSENSTGLVSQCNTNNFNQSVNDENLLIFSNGKNFSENDTSDSLSVGSYERAVTPSVENAFVLDPIVSLISNDKENEDSTTSSPESGLIHSENAAQVTNLITTKKLESNVNDLSDPNFFRNVFDQHENSDDQHLQRADYINFTSTEDKNCLQEDETSSCSSSGSLFDIEDIDEALATLDHDVFNDSKNQNDSCLHITHYGNKNKATDEENLNLKNNETSVSPLLFLPECTNNDKSELGYEKDADKQRMPEKCAIPQEKFPFAINYLDYFSQLHSSSGKKDVEQLVLMEDLDSLKQNNETFVPETKNFDLDDDLLIVNTETNEALLLESGRPQPHLAFVQQQFVSDEFNKLKTMDCFTNADENVDYTSNYDLSSDVSRLSNLKRQTDISSSTDVINSENSSIKTLDSALPASPHNFPNISETCSDDKMASASSPLTFDVSEPIEENNFLTIQTKLVQDVPSDATAEFLKSPEIISITKKTSVSAESESDSESSSQDSSSTSGEFDCSKNSINSNLKTVKEDDEEDNANEDVISFKPSSWDKNAIPKFSSLRSPEKKSQIKKSVSFNTPKTLFVYEYPHEERNWQEPPFSSRQLWSNNTYNPAGDLNNYTDWELGDDEIPEDVVEVEDFEESNQEMNYPFFHFNGGSLYQLSNIHCDDDDSITEDDNVDNYLYDASCSSNDILYSAGNKPYFFHELVANYNSDIAEREQNMWQSPTDSRYFFNTDGEAFNINTGISDEFDFMPYVSQDALNSEFAENNFADISPNRSYSHEGNYTNDLEYNKLIHYDSPNVSSFSEINEDNEGSEKYKVFSGHSEKEQELLDFSDVNRNVSPIVPKSLRKWSNINNIAHNAPSDETRLGDKSEQMLNSNEEDSLTCSNISMNKFHDIHHSSNGNSKLKKEESCVFPDGSNQELLI